MKKIITLVFITIITTAVFISCKKEETTSLLGKWNATKEFYTEYKNGAIITSDTTLYGVVDKISLEFASNGTGKLSYNEGNNILTDVFTYKTEGNNLIVYIDGDTSTNTYTLTSKQLTLYSSEENESEGDLYKWEYKMFLTR
jgi:hypothetical protein